MRKSEVLLTLVALVSATTGFWLWVELRAERTRNSELSARLETMTLPPVVVAEPASTEETAPVNTPPAPAIPATESTATASPPQVHGTQEDWEAYRRRMMQQPKYREAWRAQQRLTYALRRENVIRLLGFTPEQADGVVELAIDQQLRWYDLPAPNPRTEEQQRAIDELNEREDQARLQALLGEEKRARFQEYIESRATRMQVDQFRPQFTGADTLRDDQLEPLITALHVERARMRQELNEFETTLSPNDAQMSQRYTERRIKLLKEAYDRMHSAAAPILSSSQAERLNALLKRDLDRQEAQVRMTLVESKIGSAGAGVSNTN